MQIIAILRHNSAIHCHPSTPSSPLPYAFASYFSISLFAYLESAHQKHIRHSCTCISPGGLLASITITLLAARPRQHIPLSSDLPPWDRSNDLIGIRATVRVYLFSFHVNQTKIFTCTRPSSLCWCCSPPLLIFLGRSQLFKNATSNCRSALYSMIVINLVSVYLFFLHPVSI